MSTSDSPVNILVVEDNLVVQHYIRAALGTSTNNRIVAVTDNGIEALACAMRLRPDVILLDLFMPGMDGMDVIRHVMSEVPCPIIVLSGELDRQDRDLTFEAQRAGAVAVLAKPHGMEQEQFQHFSQMLCRTVQVMSQVKVTRRWLHAPAPWQETLPAVQHDLAQHDLAQHGLAPPHTAHRWELLVIGSSTGGPAALYALLEALAPTFPFPVLIAQHIGEGFGQTLCEWLCKTGCQVRIPAHGEQALPGIVYLAPDNCHMVYGPGGVLFHVVNPGARFTPSVDMLFDSVAGNHNGAVTAMILTGMGNDGTAGMQHLYRKGALTIAEAERSCVVFGMPAAAIEAGVIRREATLQDICELATAAAGHTSH